MVYVTGLVKCRVLKEELLNDLCNFNEELLELAEDEKAVGEIDEVDDTLEDDMVEELVLEAVELLLVEECEVVVEVVEVVVQGCVVPAIQSIWPI